MNPEAEFYPRKDQPDTNSGSTAGASASATATPDPTSSEAIPSCNQTGDGSDCVQGDDGHGCGPVSGAVSDNAAARDTAAHTPDPALSLAPSCNGDDAGHGYSHDPGNTPPDHTADPATTYTAGPEYGPTHYSPADAAAPPYDPNSGPVSGYYHYQNPGFDSGYAAPAYQMGYQPPPPMYHHAPVNYYHHQPYPVYPGYPAYAPTHTPNPIPNHPIPQYAYPTHAYTPSPPVYAAPPPPPPSPSHHIPHIHVPKASDGYRNSPPHLAPRVTSPTRRGEMGDPEAKIFVGDLPIGGSTQYLENCLRGLFLPFGPCWVNVSWGETAKRGGNVRNGNTQREERVKKLPTGWVQYMEVTDAETVLGAAKKRGLYIGTRRLRIERADGKRIVRLWPKNLSSNIKIQDLHTEFRRFMGWLTPKSDRELLYHISDCAEFTKKLNKAVLSVGVMFRWCEDAQYAARKFHLFPSDFHMRIESVRTMAGLPSWRTSKLDCAARMDKLELDPGHEWHDNMHDMYVEAIGDIEAELEESFDDDSSSNNNNNNNTNGSLRLPKTNTNSSSSTRSSGTASSSPSTLEDVEYEREKKVRRARNWANVVLRTELHRDEEEGEASGQNEQNVDMVLDAVEEESEDNVHLDSAVEEEETWEDDSDTVVALSDPRTSGREETREEIRKGKMAVR